MPNVKSIVTAVMEFEEDGTFKEASARRNIRSDAIYENRDEIIQTSYHFSRELLATQPQAVRDAMLAVRNAFSILADALDAVKP